MSYQPPIYNNLSTASSYFDSTTPSSALLSNPQHDDSSSSSSSFHPSSSSSSSPPQPSPSSSRCCARRRPPFCFRASWLLLNVALVILSVVLVVVDYKKLLRSTIYTSLHLGSQDHRVPRAIWIVGIASIVLGCLGFALSLCNRVWPATAPPAINTTSSSSSYAPVPSSTVQSPPSRRLRVYLFLVLLTAIVMVVLGAITLQSARKSSVATQITQAWQSVGNDNRVSLQAHYNCCGLVNFNDTWAGSACPAFSTTACLSSMQRDLRRQRRVTGGLAIGVSKLMFVSVLMWMIRRCLQRRAERREAAARAAAIVSSPSNFYLPTAPPV